MDNTHNRHNNSWICQDPDAIPMVFKCKNLASVMVLGVVFSMDHVMLPQFFLVGLRSNK